MKRLSLVLAIFIAVPAFGCAVETLGTTCCAYNADGQTSFKILGAIEQDARSPSCASGAQINLNQFLSAYDDHFFQQFLSGEYVMLVMVAGLELGGRGFMDAGLDAKIWRVAQLYQTVVKDTSDRCGFVTAPDANGNVGPNWQAGNSCQDDYAIAASGFAWKAAYARLTGREFYPSRWNALDMIHQTFNTNDALCVYDSSLPLDFLYGPCNSTPSALGPSNVKVLSFNHGSETTGYGIGLMANIAAAFFGLDVASASVSSNYEISSAEHLALQYIYKEGQDHSFLSNGKGLFSDSGCYSPDLWSNGPVYPCWDYKFRAGDPYKAGMYPLQRFYQAYGFTPGDAMGFQFNVSQFDANNFGGAFFHVGRYETYFSLAYDFIDNRPPLAPGTPPHMAFMTPDGSHFLNPTRGGGYGQWLQAVATSSSDLISQFYLIDLNGGTLNDWDAVAISSYSNPAFYLSAQNGGGGLITADAISVGANETFHIHKTGGLYYYGPIANGDGIALQTANGSWIHIDNAGGSTVTANGTGPGAFETLSYVKIDPPLQGQGGGR